MSVFPYLQWICDGCNAQLMLRQDVGLPPAWVHVDLSAAGGRGAKLMLCDVCVSFSRHGRVVGEAITQLLVKEPAAAVK